MSRTKFVGILIAFFVVLATVVMVGLAHAATSLTFVANHAELYAALEAAEKGAIGSVAISEKYYQEGTSRVQKNQIRGLIARTFEFKGRMVYLYGQPLDNDLARELIDVEAVRDCGRGLTPTFSVGAGFSEKLGRVRHCGRWDRVIQDEFELRESLMRTESFIKKRFFDNR